MGICGHTMNIISMDVLKKYYKFREKDSVSMDNHILHYGLLDGREVEADEDLETMRVTITEEF